MLKIASPTADLKSNWSADIQLQRKCKQQAIKNSKKVISVPKITRLIEDYVKVTGVVGSLM